MGVLLHHLLKMRLDNLLLFEGRNVDQSVIVKDWGECKEQMELLSIPVCMCLWTPKQ